MQKKWLQNWGKVNLGYLIHYWKDTSNCVLCSLWWSWQYCEENVADCQTTCIKQNLSTVEKILVLVVLLQAGFTVLWRKRFEVNKFKSIYMFYGSIVSPVQLVCSYMIHCLYIVTSVHIPNNLFFLQNILHDLKYVDLTSNSWMTFHNLKFQKQLLVYTNIYFCFSQLC